MKRLWPAFLLLSLGLCTMVRDGNCQNSEPDVAQDHTAPSYDMKAQSLLDLEMMEKKFTDLANAVLDDNRLPKSHRKSSS